MLKNFNSVGEMKEGPCINYIMWCEKDECYHYRSFNSKNQRIGREERMPYIILPAKVSKLLRKFETKFRVKPNKNSENKFFIDLDGTII